jgi:hypothetical protein
MNVFIYLFYLKFVMCYQHTHTVYVKQLILLYACTCLLYFLCIMNDFFVLGYVTPLLRILDVNKFKL